MLSALITAAAVAAANPNTGEDLSGGVARECQLTSSRSRSMLGYFGLGGEGPTQAFVRASGPNGHQAPFVDDISDGMGDVVGYTRIRAEFVPCAYAEDRNYKGESRDWLTRLFVGLKTEKSLTVRITIDPEDVSKDTVLMRMVRDSSKTGDEWDTQIVESKILLPYFRVGQKTTLTIAPTFIASSDYNTTVASDILELTEKATAAINPAATLITSENQPKFAKAAGFVDATVNGLLHRKIGEQGVSVRVPREVQPGGEIARILLLAPAANSTLSSKGVQPLGVWIIRAEPIIRSVFGEYDGRYGLRESSLSAPTLLASTVAEGKTVRDALLARTAVSGARDAYLEAKTDAVRDKTGAQFCSVVSQEAAKMWFTPVDVGAIVWAMAADLAPQEGARNNLLAACGGVRHLPT